MRFDWIVKAVEGRVCRLSRAVVTNKKEGCSLSEGGKEGGWYNTLSTWCPATPNNTQAEPADATSEVIPAKFEKTKHELLLPFDVDELSSHGNSGKLS